MSERSKFWLITVVTLLGVGLMLSLGRWQLTRAAEKERLQASTGERARQPVLDGGALDGGEGNALLYRRIAVRGQWLADRTVFLDNRQMNGKQGFYVVTPLQLAGRRTTVLVQRGWVPRNFEERSRLPAIQTPTGDVRVQGQIAPPPAKLYELGQAKAGAIRQNLDLAQFSAEIGVPLPALSIQETGAASDGLLRDWPPPSTGIDRHRGYAFQWFGLGALMAILYVWFQIGRRFIPRQRG